MSRHRDLETVIDRLAFINDACCMFGDENNIDLTREGATGLWYLLADIRHDLEEINGKTTRDD